MAAPTWAAAAVDHPRRRRGAHHRFDPLARRDRRGARPGEDRERRKRENDPVLKKPITSELGNVSPWIIVPGPYSESQLRFQAENVAASIVNNASFNCVATKMIVTWKDWPQREQFLDLVEEVLSRVPPRKSPTTPGARDRFEKFHRQAGARGRPASAPWTLVRDADPEQSTGLVLRGVVRLRLRRNGAGSGQRAGLPRPGRRLCQRASCGAR